MLMLMLMLLLLRALAMVIEVLHVCFLACVVV